MNRIEIIQAIIDKKGFKSYLEVGVQAGHCFSAIKCGLKFGVDPDKGSAATHHITSDEFFAENKLKFDIIFSDGLHHADQSLRDLNNMLNCLNDGGFIVCHDMLPTSKRMQEIPLTDQNEWTGDVWRSWLELRSTRNDLKMFCIDTDWGTSVITKWHQQTISLPKPVNEITYEEWDENKKEWMNIISVQEFKQMFGI